MSGVDPRIDGSLRWAATAAGITFVALLVAAALRSAPSVLMMPLQLHFEWDRATISFTAAVGIFLYGFVGPFAAALMMSFGIRRTMIAGLAIMAAATFASQWMSASWQFLVTWGVLSGIGSGAITSVLGAAVVNRWFAKRQGLVMGLLSASTATGSLIFLPAMAALTTGGAWKPVVLVVSIACLVVIPLVAFFVPERPDDVGARRYGEEPDAPDPEAGQPRPTPGLAISALVRASRHPTFWLLVATFFVCGLTTNGLVGVHMIAFCGDHGIAPVAAAGLLTTMGMFDLVGTTASGWLTDRFDPRKLLFVYYGLRGLSLLALPFIKFDAVSLGIFAVFYGLDWIATVPPTVALTNRLFGARDAPVIFGWILVGHQIGAATAAFGAGLIRSEMGSYSIAFLIAGSFGIVAGFAALILPGRRHLAEKALAAG
ncbi:MAG: MFS transporter [Sphingobium sp.]|nr:MFS transporter [Sphingobium sp.]